MEKTFNDYYYNEVTLSFKDHPFLDDPKHVLILTRYNEQWLLTKHKERGLEFPGGKVEAGETAEEGAKREVKEETGGIVNTLTYLGQYNVRGKRETIVKNVYFAEVSQLVETDTYYETHGPVLIDALPKELKTHQAYSFIMKDDVVQLALARAKTLKLW